MFALKKLLPIFLWANQPGVKVLSGYFNNDDKCDIAFLGVPGWTTIPVGFSNGDGSFKETNQKEVQISSLGKVSGAKVVSWKSRLPGARKFDIALVGGEGWNAIPVITLDGTFGFSNVSVKNFANWARVPNAKAVYGDFNGDGFSDISLLGGDGWNTIPIVHFNYGTLR